MAVTAVVVVAAAAATHVADGALGTFLRNRKFESRYLGDD